MNDAQLLRQYAKENSAVAFGQLVGRYLNLVYSAALRQTSGDVPLAEDVTQTVFADLARKAPLLTSRTDLSGWLYTSTHHAAANMIRREARRRARELEAYLMQQHSLASDPVLDWEPLQPALDQAMHELNERDREAVLLRYFQRLAYSDVGQKLGLGENAARMRVERALEKLRLILGRRGIITTGTSLAMVLAERAVADAPVEMTAAILRRPRVMVPVTLGIIALVLKMFKMAASKGGVAVLAGAAAVVFLETRPQTDDARPAGHAQTQSNSSQVLMPTPAPTDGNNQVSAATSGPMTSQYEMQGNITLRTFTPEGRINREYNGSFKVFVRDAAWLVQSYETSDLGTHLQREAGSTNGAEIFELVTDLDSAATGNGTVKALASATVSRQRAPISRSEGSFTGPLWLMFASADYFRAGTSHALAPVYDGPTASRSERGGTRTVPAEWMLLNGPGSLPSRVVYKTPTGMVVATYQTTGTTNIGSMVLPTGFSISRPAWGSFLALAGEAVVTMVRPVCARADLLPAMAGKTTTRDFRVASAAEGVSYLSDHWRSAHEAEQIYADRNPLEAVPSPVVALPVAAIFPNPSAAVKSGLPKNSSAPFRDAIIATNSSSKLPAQGPWTLSADDLNQPMTLIFELVEHPKGRGQRKNSFQPFLWGRLSDETQSELTRKYKEMHDAGNHLYQAGPELAALVKNLNQLIQGKSIYDEEAFHGVDLSGDTLQLLAEKPAGEERTRLNRLLLEDALPSSLLRRPKIIADAAFPPFAFVEFRSSKIPNFTDAVISLYGDDGAKLWTADLDAQIQEAAKNVHGTRRGNAQAADLSVGIWDVRFGETDLIVKLSGSNSVGIDLKSGSVHPLPGS